MPVHVHHVLLSLEPGGLENGVVNVVNGLDPARFRSSVCCLKSSGPFAARIRRDDVQVHSMGHGRGNDWRLPFRLARLFRATRTDIVHTRNAEAFFYAGMGARLAGIPVLLHSEHGRTFNDRAVRLYAQRLLSRWADGIFAVSGTLRDDLVRHVGLPPSRVDVLHNGVDRSRFGGADRECARRLLGLDAGSLVVGSVGRLVAVKNYALLLKAFAALRRDDAVLLLAGDGPERPALEQLVQGLGLASSVRLLGHRDDVPAVLAALDVFALSSRSEGMSNTLLEAMAAGLPIVATRVGGNAEIVRDGVDGLLVDDDDAPGFAHALRGLAEHAGRRAAMGAAGRERVATEFSIEAMVERYARYYLTHLERARVAGRASVSETRP